MIQQKVWKKKRSALMLIFCTVCQKAWDQNNIHISILCVWIWRSPLTKTFSILYWLSHLLQYTSGIEVLACSLDTALNYVTTMFPGFENSCMWRMSVHLSYMHICIIAFFHEWSGTHFNFQLDCKTSKFYLSLTL